MPPFPTFHTRSRVRLVVLVVLSVVTAWGIGHVPPSARASSRALAAPRFQIDVSTSDLSLGRHRFAFGLLQNNHPVSIHQIRVQLFFISARGASTEQTLNATFNDFARGLKNAGVDATATQLRGVYVAYPTFQHSGTWGVQASLPVPGGMQLIRQEFVVQRHERTPAIGSPAPRSHNPTAKQISVYKLDSGRPPNDMHGLSIAGAIAEHKPLLVVFGSPAYCQSRICGPETEIVQRIEGKYRRAVNFIHIETYKDADPSRGPSATFVQWHLETDPWVFVIDRHGIIRAKFEGPTSAGEIESALHALR